MLPVYTERFHSLVEVDLLEEAVAPTISAIDDNLDEINRKKASFENQIFQTQGAIGSIQSLINTIGTEIENYFN